MLLFSLVTLLEMQMQRLIHHYYPDDSWVERLKPKTRLEAAQKLHADRLARKEEIDLVDCLQFADKREILLATEEWLEAIQHITSKKKAERSLKKLGTLRDHVAHGQDLLLGRSWSSLIELTATAVQLLGEFERIHTSD